MGGMQLHPPTLDSQVKVLPEYGKFAFDRTLEAARNGGGVISVSDYLHGIMLQVEWLKADLCEVLGDVPPPGKATVMTYSASDGRASGQCGNTGKVLWRACPKCGDIGFDYLNGRDEADGIVCRNGCGFNWAADDPRWLAQRLPFSVLAA
jgi:hypothetical protein